MSSGMQLPTLQFRYRLSKTNDDSPNCRKRLWVSENQLVPEDPSRAEELLRRRSRRTMCRCSLETRARVDLYDTYLTSYLKSKADWASID